MSKEYNGVFNLHYKNYCVQNKLEKAPASKIKQWISDSTDTFSGLAGSQMDVHVILNMFEIDDTDENMFNLINKNYKIELVDTENDEDSMQLLLKYKLVFTE